VKVPSPKLTLQHAKHIYSELPKYSDTTGHTYISPKREIISVHRGTFFKNTTEIEIAQSVNGNDTSHNAQ
jgi:hypothetical protein